MSFNSGQESSSSANNSGNNNNNNNNNAFLNTPSSPSRSTTRLEPPSLQTTAMNPLLRSPTTPRRRKVIYSDRYIPNRTGVDLQAAFNLTNDKTLGRKILFNDLDGDFDVPSNTRYDESLNNASNNNNSVGGRSRTDAETDSLREEEANRTFNTVLKAELFGDNVPSVTSNSFMSLSRGDSLGSHSTAGSAQLRTPPRSRTDSSLNFASGTNNLKPASTPRQSGNLFTYQSPTKSRPTSSSLDVQNELYSLSPVRADSQRLLLSPQKKLRNISKVPYRVLDAPELADDFYLNLVDWGSTDILGVGLGSCVYLWNGTTGSVDRLCNLGENDTVTSISWIGSGSHLAVGTGSGLVEIWDVAAQKCTRTMTGHSLRTSSLLWNEHVLSSGSRDRSILHRDVREASHFMKRLEIHKQEVCGLKWNVEENKLASGGNDNKLYVWDGLYEKPLHKFTEHVAAVKAISWSPHQRGILASGGGTTDRRIKIWNTINGTKLHDIDTGSQVCNLAWSKNSNELVSTHGFSKNQIIVWKYPSMQQVASLMGHTYRVLYLAMSPDGQTVVTGAGDETLRFWNIFDKNKNENEPPSVLLDAFMQLR